MKKQTIFSGESLVEVYKNISSVHKDGVVFLSTKQKKIGKKIGYEVIIQADIISKVDLFMRFKNKLISKGLDFDWLEHISSKVIHDRLYDDAELTINYMVDEIDSDLAIKELASKNRQQITMMVGTTGVGKTTTIAKLANKSDSEVIFLNLDHYRVAASEQLKSYANISGASYDDIYDSSALNDKLKELPRDCTVFIDTAGISPTDISKFLETISYLNDSSTINIDISLVMPATFKKEDLIYAYEHFSFLNISSLIITKFDETSSITGLVDFLRTCPIELEYFSVGQKVPNDIINASSDYITQRLRKEWVELYDQ